MSDATAALARTITWASSKQTYYTARLTVDKDLVNDFYRAYAYFRWIDDIVDTETSNDVTSPSDDERISFIRRQRELIDRLYRNERTDDLTPEEEIVADLISHDRAENSGLQSFIRNMFAIIEFDAYRKGRLISQQELDWYTDSLAKSVTDGLLYFIGNGHPHPTTGGRYQAGLAAHIAHLLRDIVQDTADGLALVRSDVPVAVAVEPLKLIARAKELAVADLSITIGVHCREPTWDRRVRRDPSRRRENQFVVSDRIAAQNGNRHVRRDLMKLEQIIVVHVQRSQLIR